MLNIPIVKKYKYVIKRSLKPNGLKKPFFIKPNIVSAIVCEDTILDRTQILKINLFLLKYIKKQGSLYFPCLKLKPKTEKPVGVRMGKGKGSINCWIVTLRRGSILFQIDGISSLFFIKDLNKLNSFLPGLIKFIVVKY